MRFFPEIRLFACCLFMYAYNDCSAADTTSSSDLLTTVGDVLVPPGVTYKPASAKANTAARAMLTKLFSGGASDKEIAQVLGGGSVFIGPCLWAELKQSSPGIEKKLNTQVSLNAPLQDGGGKDAGKQQQSGTMLKTTANVKDFWAALKNLVESGGASLHKPLIRKLTPHELSLYWYWIPFDIEEPVFIVELGKYHFVVDLQGDELRAIWIDDLGCATYQVGIIRKDPETGSEQLSVVYTPGPEGATRPSKGRVSLGHVELITATSVIESNVQPNEVASWVDKIESAIARITQASSSSYGLRLAITLFSDKKPKLELSQNGEASNQELQEIYDALQGIPPLHTRTDEVKLAVFFNIGEDASDAPTTASQSLQPVREN